MKLSKHLVSITLWTVAPLMLFVMGGVVLFLNQERNTYRGGAINRLRALSTAVDAELRSTAAPLETLATSSRFDGGELSAIENDVARVVASVPAWQAAHIYALDTHTEVLLGHPLDKALARRISEAAQTMTSTGPVLAFSNAIATPALAWLLANISLRTSLSRCKRSCCLPRGFQTSIR